MFSTGFRQSIARSPQCAALRLSTNRVHQARLFSQLPRGSGKKRLDSTSATYIGVAVGVLLGGSYIANLENAPETGRRRLMVVSQKQEERIGTAALEETLQEYRGRILPLDHPLTQQVRRITRRIITSSNLGHLKGDLPPMIDMWSAGAEVPRPATTNPDKEWVVLVINDRNFVNAFALPGLVAVSTGIMPVARNEEGLAAIIGHEIGHVTMRHAAERLSQTFLFLPILVLLAVIGVDPSISTLVNKYALSLPHSRALETEADMVGLKLMSRACYDPGAAPRVFEDLKKLEGGANVPKFMNTHPPTAERIARLNALLPESYSIYNSNPECTILDDMRSRGFLGRVRMNIE
ncbi:peptidase family M48-domain-containing protein [Mycena crocata]|nr:peptidase family M48-domain-containing protein [Mycena crocata]